MSAYEGDSGAGAPNEEQLRAYEEELARISVTDMVAQVTVSLLNLGARRLAPPGEGEGGGPSAGAPADAGDLEEVRDAIDAASALMDILERRIPNELAPLRDALSRLQMAYAREARAAPEGQAGTPGEGVQGGGEGDGGAAPQGGEATQESRRPGPAESSGRLWVPGS